MKTVYKIATTYLIVIQIVLANFLFAQNDTITTSNNSTFRNFDTQKITDYQNSEDFIYINEKPYSPAFIDWIKAKYAQFMDWLFGSEKSKTYSGNFFDVMKWVIIIIGVLLVMANILGVEFTQLFTRKHDIKENIFNEALEENINELNFEELIEQHLNQKNYRYVVRLYYLKALKNLSDNETINWQASKTNQEYYNEIEDTETQQAFGKITDLFNHVWYGEFEVNEHKLKDYITDFNNFNKQINQLNFA